LSKGADPNIESVEGITPLQIAVGEGFAEVAKALLDAKADLDRTNSVGVNALMLASAKRNVAMVKFLLSKGADPNLAYQLAKGRGQADVVKILESAGAKEQWSLLNARK
jgi:ankyrin repeat protein